MSFSPATRLAYIPVNEQGRIYGDPPGDLKNWHHATGEVISTGVDTRPLPDTVSSSALIAWDPVKQKQMWRAPHTAVRNGGTVATAGNLIFQGQLAGDFVAYAADTGKKLWSFYAQTGVMAQPITYSAGGKQFVTVIAGSRNVGATGLKTEWNYYTQKWRVLTFALDGTATLPPEDKREPPLMDDPQFAIDPAKVAIGKTVFAQRCANCHGGAVVSGGAAPDLRRAAGPLSLESLVEILKNGALRNRGMPRFEELTTPEIEGLQHYIRQRARDGLAG
jgi:quinohemoprotein ethanol dehydrogenase